jgi:hypothetical protein
VTDPTPDLEARVHAALAAEADTVHPGDGSLDSIRSRARAAHRRRRGAALAGAGMVALVALAVAVPLLDGPTDPDVSTGSEGDRSATTQAPDPSAPGTTVPGEPADVLDQAMWPDPAGELLTDPTAAARSFVEDMIGVEDPPLSSFREGEPGAGEVDVLQLDEDGSVSDRVAATVVVRRLDGEHWFVTSASSPDVQIDTPEPVSVVSSPITVTGRGRGFEGNILVDLRTRDSGGEIGAASPTIAGAGAELEPFSVEVPFDFSPSPVAIVVAMNSSGASFAVPGFSAVPVVLGDPGGGQEEPVYVFASQPLWPFRTQAEADRWLTEGRPDGHQPWHDSAEDTALMFTQSYLGFIEIDQVTSDEVGATEAWIGVGYVPEPGAEAATAAVVHLVRFGPDPDAPWEVVGTRDTTLTLKTPRYGSPLSSPLTVGGTVTGVDESLQVHVRQQSSPQLLGESCCLPAGGEVMPWEATVEVTGEVVDPAVTVVVFTGGHVQDVERFAITGLRG